MCHSLQSTSIFHFKLNWNIGKPQNLKSMYYMMKMQCKFYLENNLNPTKTKVCGSRLIVLFHFYSTICYYGIFCIQVVEFLICGFNNQGHWISRILKPKKDLYSQQAYKKKSIIPKQEFTMFWWFCKVFDQNQVPSKYNLV